PFKVNFSWDKLEGRKLGVVGAIKPDADGKHIWILDRCGGNGCAESDLDPIIQVDMEGKFVKSFGKGIINLPHGFFVDREGFVWVTDGAPGGGGIGSEGNLPLQFNDPHDLQTDSEGRLYVADRGNQRVQVLDKEGNFITRFTQFGKPSALAFDNKGNIYVADGMSDDHWNPGW